MNFQGLRKDFAFSIGLAALAFSALSSCGGEDSSGPAPSGGTSSPTPTPTASPAVTYVATPVPFGLTQDTTFEILGLYRTGSFSDVSNLQIRWNSAASAFEIVTDGRTQWAQLKLRSDGEGRSFDAFTPGGELLPFQVSISLWASFPNQPQHLGEVRVIEDNLFVTWAAFGTATPATYVPPTGTLNCAFGMDEIGDGAIAIDFVAGSASGNVVAFWGIGNNPPPSFTLGDSEVRPDSSIDVRAAFGSSPGNRLEARLFGPEAQDIAVRSKGEVSGLMIGSCKP